jgi:non-ribosomal peptide synthetase component F
VLCGGEALSADLAAALVERCGELWNMYGPTETTVWSTRARITAGDGSIPIGRPIANTTVHVLDDQRQPVPLGAVGELYIGGEGVLPRSPRATLERLSDLFRMDRTRPTTATSAGVGP